MWQAKICQHACNIVIRSKLVIKALVANLVLYNVSIRFASYSKPIIQNQTLYNRLDDQRSQYSSQN